MFVTGFASIHLVKFPCADVSFPTLSIPHRCRSHDGAINYEGCAGAL
jgi:hypothetical protein